MFKWSSQRYTVTNATDTLDIVNRLNLKIDVSETWFVSIFSWKGW